MKKPKKSDIEIIEWVDSASSAGWNYPRRAKIAKIVSCGWVTSETKDSIAITSHIDHTYGNHNSDMSIPKVAIVKRFRILS
jgi:hypothetical protein